MRLKLLEDIRDKALQQQANEVGQRDALVGRMHELSNHMDAQVSILQSSIGGFSKENFASLNKFCYLKWNDSKRYVVNLNS